MYSNNNILYEKLFLTRALWNCDKKTLIPIFPAQKIIIIITKENANNNIKICCHYGIIYKRKICRKWKIICANNISELENKLQMMYKEKPMYKQLFNFILLTIKEYKQNYESYLLNNDKRR